MNRTLNHRPSRRPPHRGRLVAKNDREPNIRSRTPLKVPPSTPQRRPSASNWGQPISPMPQLLRKYGVWLVILLMGVGLICVMGA